MKCEVIYVNFNHPSFNWGNGQYFILESNDFDYHMVKLDGGIPQTYDDGRYMVTIISRQNSGIRRTQMFFETDEKAYERTLKFDKLLRNSN